MATRLKTVEFSHQALAAVVDNTLTTLPQMTVYLPETGTKTFHSVVATMSIVGTATAAGNVTSRNLQCRLGSAGYSAASNTNLYTGSGEDIILHHSNDLTAHFTSNWTGTSMTFDSQVQIDGTATSIAWTNCCVTLRITYEYDDTSTTQVKTVFIPLNAPVGTLATAKPGAAVATIPNLSTELPETSKVFRSLHVVVQGNTTYTTTTDATITMQIDSTAAHTSGIFEAGQQTAGWFRYVWDCSAVLVTNATNGWYIWASVAQFNHLQAWLVVTYEFDSTGSTGCFVSLKLPCDFTGPMGGTAATGAQKGDAKFTIAEPGTITTKQVAFYGFWSQIAAIAGLNLRIGNGSFVTYTDAAAVVAGSVGCMIRDDAAFTLNNGLNTLTVDAYRTDTSDLGWFLGGFFIVNYTSGKPIQGYGAANHTVVKHLQTYGTGAAAGSATLAAVAINLPETDYYLSNVGVGFHCFTNTTGQLSGGIVRIERLTAEGGVRWHNALNEQVHTDPESGLSSFFKAISGLFRPYPTCPIPDCIPPATARRWEWFINQSIATSVWAHLDVYYTYHSITYTFAGTVSGYVDSDGAGLVVNIFRTLASGLVEHLGIVTTTSGGAFTFKWYENSLQCFATCHEDATHVGASQLVAI